MSDLDHAAVVGLASMRSGAGGRRQARAPRVRARPGREEGCMTGHCPTTRPPCGESSSSWPPAGG